ncbi:MAG: hypothetical protein JRI68_15415 [Deltaproteobacteria bacterium]|nr:hypothetical protein [Deltaproteobacteria bacterium]
MTRIRRTAIAVAATLAAVVALPTVASAQVRLQRSPIVKLQRRPATTKSFTQSAASYQRSVEAKLAQSQSRIQNALRRHRISLATYQQVQNDLTEGRRLIRSRVAAAIADGKVTAHERSQVNVLVNAIAADLTKTYGPIDSWRLL